jgi:HD-GYP domain-containing protein (c-di-GMP phosphodiesterase class II)
MSASVEGLLKDLQNAIGSRALYPADHPRTREGVARIEKQLDELTAVSGELSVFAVDDKVIHGGAAIPGGEPIARGLFRILRAGGYDRLTIRRGVSREEIDRFLSLLAEASKRADSPATGAVSPSAHIRLSAFRGASPEELSAHVSDDEFLHEEVQVLGEVWSGVVERKSLDVDSVEEIVVALSRTVEENIGAMIPMASLKSYDEYTGTHIINVALLAMALGEAVGLPENVVHDVGIAALLHDVGKLKVPTEILNKPDRLTEEEFATIRLHPEEGSRILFSTPRVPELAVIVAYEHHIRYEGGGYPLVPSGWKMNLGSAITQVADIYDALRTDRPYRRGLDRETIVRMMRADACRQFDPDLLAAFFERVVPKTHPLG